MSGELYLKGLIVREPYVQWIVEGRKVWELRKVNTRIRGAIALVSQKRLYGFAELVKTFEAEVTYLMTQMDKHRAPPEFLIAYAGGRKKLYVWEFRPLIKLPKPVRVEYGKGAQIWVNISYSSIVKSLVSEGLTSYVKEVEDKVLSKVVGGSRPPNRRRQLSVHDFRNE